MDIEIRPAEDTEISEITELIADRIGDEDAVEADIVLRDRDFDRNRWLVAADGSRVLSTAAIFPGQLRVGDVAVTAGAVEFVATREDAAGQGLVRLLMDEIHRTAPARSELVQWIVGITYFYRKFGYEYAIPVDGMNLFEATNVPALPAGWSVRAIEPEEVQTVTDAQNLFARQADVSITGTKWMWDVYRRSPSYQVLLAGGPNEHGMGRVYSYGDDRYLTDVAVYSPDAAAALINAASEDGNWDVTAMSRLGAREHLDWLAPHVDSGDAYYLRATDPVALLETLRPVLSQRLASQPSRNLEGDALISMYGSSVRFEYGNLRVGPMRREGPVPGPIGAGGSGVAPDLIVSLILGPLGAAGLAARHADVNLGQQAELMETLFPPQTCDVHSWVVP